MKRVHALTIAALIGSLPALAACPSQSGGKADGGAGEAEPADGGEQTKPVAEPETPRGIEATLT